VAARADFAAPLPGVKEHGYWADAWQTLRRDWVAMTGLAIVVGLALAAALVPIIAPYDPDFQQALGLSVNGQPMGPSPGYLLGTDALGRDEFSRLLFGARVSLTVGIASNLLSSLFGVTIGGLAGMANGRLQSVTMRAVDVLLSFPILRSPLHCYQ
jgi:peptide/nickel transport system permease protein